MLKASARGSGLGRLLGTIEPRPFSGTVYRVIGSRHLRSPLASAGSKLHGGRFNPPGRFEVLYTALAADTALVEREGILLTAAAIKLVRGVRTAVLLRIECRLTSILDLADERIRRQLRIPLVDLLGPWLPWNFPVRSDAVDQPETHVAPSQLIGVSVYASRRFEAILAPSSKDPAGRCLAIMPERLHASSSVSVDDPEGTISRALGLPQRPQRP